MKCNKQNNNKKTVTECMLGALCKDIAEKKNNKKTEKTEWYLTVDKTNNLNDPSSV